MSTIGDVASTGLNWALNEYSRNQQNEFNAAEALKQRNWQSNEATIAYQRQLAMIADQRSYDTAAAQMQRFVDAGLNPDLIYGQMNPGLMANNPDMAEGGYAASGTAPNYNALAEGMLAASQARKNNAEAENIEIENEKKPTLLDKQIELYGAKINATNQEIEVMKADVSRLTEETNKLKQSILNLQEEHKILKSTASMKSREDAFDAITWNDRLVGFHSDTGIKFQTAKYIGMYYAASILNLNEQAKYYASMIPFYEQYKDVMQWQASLLHEDFIVNSSMRPERSAAVASASRAAGTQADLLDFAFEQAQRFSSFKKIAEILNLGIQAGRSLVDVISAFPVPGKPIGFLHK